MSESALTSKSSSLAHSVRLECEMVGKNGAAEQGPRPTEGPELVQGAKERSVQKGKEWAGRIGPQSMRGFKAKRKVFVHKLKTVVGFSMSQGYRGSSGPTGLRMHLSHPKHTSGSSMEWWEGWTGDPGASSSKGGAGDRGVLPTVTEAPAIVPVALVDSPGAIPGGGVSLGGARDPQSSPGLTLLAKGTQTLTEKPSPVAPTVDPIVAMSRKDFRGMGSRFKAGKSLFLPEAVSSCRGEEVAHQTNSKILSPVIEVRDLVPWSHDVGYQEEVQGSEGLGIPQEQRFFGGYPGYSHPFDGGHMSLGLGCSEVVKLCEVGQFGGEYDRATGLGCSGVVELCEAGQSGGENDRAAETRDEAQVPSEIDVPPPLNTYGPTAGGASGYSDWDIQCANEIYPIVRISYTGHKLQLLALLTFFRRGTKE